MTTEGFDDCEMLELNQPIIIEPKELSEVEKAQQTVKSWTDKIAYHEKELHFAKKNLKIHQTALKALIELEKEMSG